jgi:uncharacterized membrane protein
MGVGMKKWYAILAASGAAGMVSDFLSTLERLKLAENHNAVLTCNLNGVFSCSSVLDAWQSSVFGFPNSVFCLVLFTVIFTVGIIGLFGGQITKGVRLAAQGLTLFMLGFGLWYMYETAFVVGTLCVYCTVCFAAVILANVAMFRLNAADLPLPGRAKACLQGGMAKGADLFAWFLLAAAVAFALLVAFR